MELDISFMAKLVGEISISQHFWKASQQRKKAIDSIFWNEKKGQWLDYWLSTGPGCKVFWYTSLKQYDAV